MVYAWQLYCDTLVVLSLLYISMSRLLDATTPPERAAEEELADAGLRPRTLNEYIGQDNIKDNLLIQITAARQRNESLDHVLLYGGPGLGKTTLAHVIAREIGVPIRVTSGPALEKPGDLAAILTNLNPGDILFIDEIHRLPRTVEEVLYPAMEDFGLDIVIGKGPSAKMLRIDLPRFTIIGATTRISLLSSPLRDRFGVSHHLDFYTLQDLEKIIRRSARILNIDIDDVSATTIAERARRTPRLANRLLRRVRDYSEVKSDGKLNEELCGLALDLLQIDQLGLDRVDRKILETIIDKFAGGPVGVATLAAATGEDLATIEEVYEPYLLQIGFLDRTPRGRTATPHAYKHLGRAIGTQS